jgi:hypothetical protein
VRPWGFWKPIREKIVAENPDFKPNRNFKQDVLNIFLGTAIQTGLVALPIYIVLMKTRGIIFFAALIIILGIIMKKTWWNKLREVD